MSFDQETRIEPTLYRAAKLSIRIPNAPRVNRDPNEDVACHREQVGAHLILVKLVAHSVTENDTRRFEVSHVFL